MVRVAQKLFLDALGLLDTLKGTHAAIITQLSSTVKGGSVEVISAMLLNLQQKNKTANQYTKEVEKLTKAFEGAYISEGLSQILANKYSTTTAVKSMTQNCSINKVKVIMQACSDNI